MHIRIRVKFTDTSFKEGVMPKGSAGDQGSEDMTSGTLKAQGDPNPA